MGSSAYEKIEEKKKSVDEKEETIENKENLSKKQQKFLNDIDSDDEGFKEFLEVMRPRQAASSRTWGNDDITAVKGKEKQTVSKVIPPNPEDDLYQDLPNNYHGEEDVDENASIASEPLSESGSANVDQNHPNSIAFDSTLSDLDYMKLKMKESLDKEQAAQKEVDLKKSETAMKVNPGRLAFLQEAGVVDNSIISSYQNPVSSLPHSHKSEDVTNANEIIEQENVVIASEQPHSIYTETPSPDLIADTGRLMIRNLAYCCTYEDLEDHFTPFGKIAEIHLPIDKITKESKGYAFILYMLPEDAVKAFTSLDKTIFQGRILEIVAAKEKLKSADELSAERGEETFKEKKERNLKSSASHDFNWNSLFMNVRIFLNI
jgi:multiple RNA-binding domain-containing protein 1